MRLPFHVMEHINNLNLNLRPDVDDNAVWTLEQNGNFTVASAWQRLRKKRIKRGLTP